MCCGLLVLSVTWTLAKPAAMFHKGALQAYPGSLTISISSDSNTRLIDTINSLKWTTTTPTSNFKKWSCLPSQWFLLLSKRPSASFKYRMPSEPTSSCPSSAMRDHKMSRYSHDHKVPVSQHELAMTFDRSYRSMWRMKRNMRFKGEFPLPNFHPGNLPVMLGVECHRQDDC